MRYGLALLLVGCSGGGVGDIGSKTETYEGSFGTIIAQASAGRIELVAGEDDGAITVEFLPNGSDTWTADEGDDLNLIATCMGDDEVGCGGGFIITMPPGQAADIESQRGDLNLGARLHGEIVAQTASSSINGSGLGAASVTALTGTGPVGLSFAETPTAIDVDTGSSQIAISVPSGGYALDLDTTGEITTEGVTDDPSGPPLRAHSGTGNVTVDGV